ncbi:MAG: DUF86 domain-containing protein [bacterium]|nr:DUF86 domain-containing protein [bacterium]MCY3952545.1 DUF86 domain-containing protein [bacterium]MCY4104976.1 DUF86 domain-containing protein [bacterium]
MSEPDRDRDWRFYVQDMVEFGERVAAYVEGLDQQAFKADQRTYDAALRNIELLGEAATHVPESVRAEHPEIAWRQIVGTRNRLAHGYLGIDDDVIWDIIQTDIPGLLDALRRLADDERA